MAESDSCASYKAAGVIFFTQEAGQVLNVLLALEERKVSAKLLGIELEAGGSGASKVSTDVVVFPQGRREKKDEGDPVETAMREYHEEMGNFGALTEHLLRFYEDDAESCSDSKAAPRAKPEPVAVARAGSFVMYFGLARMVVVFCEVPMSAYRRSLQILSKSDFFPDVSARRPADPKHDATADTSEQDQAKKRRKTDASYRVGKENHLTPVWVSAEALRAVVMDIDKNQGTQRCARVEVTVCARKSIDGTGHIGVSGHEPGQGGVRRSVSFFPLNLSVFRQREARIWLGLPPAEGSSLVKEPV